MNSAWWQQWAHNLKSAGYTCGPRVHVKRKCLRKRLIRWEFLHVYQHQTFLRNYCSAHVSHCHAVRRRNLSHCSHRLSQGYELKWRNKCSPVICNIVSQRCLYVHVSAASKCLLEERTYVQYRTCNPCRHNWTPIVEFWNNFVDAPRHYGTRITIQLHTVCTAPDKFQRPYGY